MTFRLIRNPTTGQLDYSEDADFDSEFAEIDARLDFLEDAIIASGVQNLYVQDTDPGLTIPGMWVQTGLPGDGMTFWVEDGV